MRRHALGLLASGAVLFVASAIGVMGTWASVTAVLLLTVGALLLAIAMEDTPASASHLAGTSLAASGTGPDLAA